MDKKEARALRRIEKSTLNTKVGLISNIVIGVLSFVERTVFNQFFIEDYLGLYSFNYNIISILTFLELGLSTSISYALYAPLERNDKEQINAIMCFFKKAYMLIGTLTLLAGFALLPFFNKLITTDVNLMEAKLYFLLFFISNASIYFLDYRNILFSANQEQYKVTITTNVAWALLYLIEITITVTTQNFLYYSIAIFSIIIIRNIVYAVMAKKDYPYVGKKPKAKIEPDTKDHILKNTKGLVLTRLGITLVSSTDSLLISAMVGTATLGKYSNYQMISSGLLTLAILLPQSITASLGNAGVTETKRTMSKGFEVLDLSSFFIYSLLTIVLINVYNPIITAFFGSQRTLSFTTVILICLNFYIQAMRELFLSYKTSLGLYWEDRKRPIIEGLTNLVTSIILGRIWGLDGIILGTIITGICVNLVIEPRIILHNGLSRSAFWFYISTTLRFLLVVAICILTLFINVNIKITENLTANLTIGSFSIGNASILEIAVYSIVAIAVTSFVYLIVFYRTESVKTIIKTLRKLTKRKEK